MSRIPPSRSAARARERIAQALHGLTAGRRAEAGGSGVRPPGGMPRDLVDPQLFANLEDLALVARTVVEGFLHGLHRSPYVGFSVEFASHREYMPGDDLRHLNWKLYARHDRLYVKQYDAETNLDCHLLLDASGSMETRTAGPSKRRYASVLAAAVAHLALKQNDAVGVTLFADRVLAHVKPRARLQQLDEVLQAIVHVADHPAAATARALHEAAELMPRRGLVVLVSDLFYPPAEVFSGLDHLRFLGHDLLVFHVLDPLESHLPLEGTVRFRDLETGAELTTQADAIRPAYQAAIAAWLDDLDDGCRGREIDRVTLATDEPLDRALYDYLTKRSHHF
jgi:uncharacterized protein (DUF58 family)